MKPIASNVTDPKSMLVELASALKDKGQIATVSSASRSDEVLSLVFGSAGKWDKLVSRLSPGHLKVRREAAFGEISMLVKTSRVENGDQLLANIRTVMDRTGKLKGKDVASQILHFIS